MKDSRSGGRLVELVKIEEIIMQDITYFEVYQKSLAFSKEIWSIVIKWGFFIQKTVGNQLVRAVNSISANIAEGYGRYHFKENLNFCYYARGSFEEIKDWLRKGYERNLITKIDKEMSEKVVDMFPRQLNSYINRIKECMEK